MAYPQSPPQPVDKQIHGVLGQIEPRQAGWMRFHIMEQGNNYATRVDTKQQEIIQQAMSLIGQPVAAQIREQESTQINPHNGRPYINRYLNAIAPAGYTPGVMPQPGAPMPQPSPQGYQQQPVMPMQPQPQQQYQPQPQQFQQQPQPVQPQVQPGLMGYDKDINIMRQCAGKIASIMLPYLPPEQQNITSLVEICESWMAYFVHGPLRFGVQPFAEAQQRGDQDGQYVSADPGPQQGDPGPQYG